MTYNKLHTQNFVPLASAAAPVLARILAGRMTSSTPQTRAGFVPARETAVSDALLPVIRAQNFMVSEALNVRPGPGIMLSDRGSR